MYVCSGAVQWGSAVGQRSGAAQWGSAVEQRSGAAQWGSAVGQRSGAAQWGSAVKQCTDTRKLYKKMKQNILIQSAIETEFSDWKFNTELSQVDF